jgi:hypothetical protein
VSLTIVLVVIVALAAALAVIVLQRSAHAGDVPVPVRPSGEAAVLADDDFSSTGEPFAVDSTAAVATVAAASDEGTSIAAGSAGDVRAEAPPEPPVPAWTSQVAGPTEPLDDEARGRLLGDLGIVRAPWCVPILAQAYAEESKSALRCAALLALVGLRGSAEARAVLAQAAESPDASERAIAVAALANTQPAAAP